MSLDDLSRLEAMDVLGQLGVAITEGRLGSAVRLAGISDDLAEEMTMDDLTDALQVRMATIARRAGIVLR